MVDDIAKINCSLGALELKRMSDHLSIMALCGDTEGDCAVVLLNKRDRRLLREALDEAEKLIEAADDE